MNIIYNKESLDHLYDLSEFVIFLAGPTPRDNNTPSWRPEAVELFKKYGFEGTLIYPEWRSGERGPLTEYAEQIDWEHTGLREVDSLVMFWVPRDMETMPALTTNIEFGLCIGECSDAIIYGRPDNSDRNRYLDYAYTKETDRKPCTTLEDTVVESIKHCYKRKQDFWRLMKNEA